MSDSAAAADEHGAPHRMRARRAGVSSESVSKEAIEKWRPPVYEKSEADKTFLRNVINEKLGLLFGHLGPEQKDAALMAMQRREVPKDTNLITQGDMGDYFYIVDTGSVDIFVKRGDNEPVKVMTAARGLSFGELALLYNAPRAATCTATEDCVVWALDRESFKMMLVTSENAKRRTYEGFLEQVQIFQALNRYERCQLSDILTPEDFKDGERIIQQGEAGEKFFIVQSGTVRCTMSEAGGPEIEVIRYERGGYFGELALLREGPRKASAYAVGPVRLLWIDKPTFDRVLGPIIDLLKANADRYPSYAEMLKANSG